ncbi:MAG: hypothetical protein V1728_04845 [Candidatus Micrarchaeota archaeon]
MPILPPMLIPLSIRLADPSREQIQNLCLVAALAGLLLLYFWPAKSGYSPSSIAQALLATDNKFLLLGGSAKELKLSATSPKFKLCSPEDSCISVLLDARSAAADSISSMDLREGDLLDVYGQVSSVQGNRFMRAQIIETSAAG